MKIYVDKSPEDCRECKLCRIKNVASGYLFCQLNDESFLESQRESYKSKNCPLKELTNAQLAIGWVFENPHIVFNKFTDKSFVTESSESKSYSFCQFHNTTWELRKPQFVLTDWKGARESCVNGKKVTNIKNGSIVILGKRGEDYIIFDERNLLQIMSDELYDSTEWKIWN